MSDDRRSFGPLLAELRVKRNAVIGLGAGIGLATIGYLYRVILVDPAPGAVSSPWLFAALAFVLAVTLGAFVAIALTVGTAVRRARLDP